MNQEFSLPPVLFELNQVFVDRGRSLYLVGGAVRNLVLGREPKDWDLCTDAPPQEVQAMFKRVIPTGIKHGTVTVLHRGDEFEITTFRLDGAYSDSRRPDSVTYTSDIVEDLGRRDFTMNAMAINLADSILLDPFDGRKDLAAGIIRTVGDPLVRFDEDGLRIARALRFAAQLGFSIEEGTWKAIPQRLSKLEGVSVERFRDEFMKTLHSPHAVRGMELFAQAGAFRRFLPELERRYHVALDDLDRTSLLCFGAEMAELLPLKDDTLRLAALLAPMPPLNIPGEDPGLILRRLKLSNLHIAECTRFLEHLAPLPQDDAAPAEVRKRLSRVGPAHAPRLLELHEAWLTCWERHGGPRLFDSDAWKRQVSEELAKKPPLSTGDLAIDGTALQKELDLPPSRLVGIILEKLLSKVIEDPALNERSALLDLARELVHKLKQGGRP